MTEELGLVERAGRWPAYERDHATDISIAVKHHSVVQRLAGRRVTLRLEADPAHMIFDGVLARAMPLTLSATTTPIT